MQDYCFSTKSKNVLSFTITSSVISSSVLMSNIFFVKKYLRNTGFARFFFDPFSDSGWKSINTDISKRQFQILQSWFGLETMRTSNDWINDNSTFEDSWWWIFYGHSWGFPKRAALHFNIYKPGVFALTLIHKCQKKYPAFNNLKTGYNTCPGKETTKVCNAHLAAAAAAVG